jgi:hypothetical protein
MTILWSFVIAVVAAFITTVVFNFFLHRMTDNARKPWMTKDHQRLIELLAHNNALAVVQLPNASDQNYEVTIMPINHRIAGGIEDKELEAFDEMMEQRIVLPVNGRQYRLSRTYREKYRKRVIMLAYEEFGVKSIVGWLQTLFPFGKGPTSARIRA